MTSRKGRRDEDDKNDNSDGDTVKAKSSTLVVVGENKSDVAKENIRTEYCDNNVSDVKAVVQVNVMSDGCADNTDKEKYSTATSTTKECNVKDGARSTVINTYDDIDSDGTDKGGGDTYIKTENSSNAVSDKNINSSNILPEKVKDKREKEHGGGSSKCKSKKSRSEHGSACEGSTKKGLVHSVENKDKVVKTTAKKSGSVENKNDGNTELEVVRGDDDDDATDVEYYNDEQSYKGLSFSDSLLRLFLSQVLLRQSIYRCQSLLCLSCQCKPQHEPYLLNCTKYCHTHVHSVKSVDAVLVSVSASMYTCICHSLSVCLLAPSPLRLLIFLCQ